jgi:hypothetical protein
MPAAARRSQAWGPDGRPRLSRIRPEPGYHGLRNAPYERAGGQPAALCGRGSGRYPQRGWSIGQEWAPVPLLPGGRARRSPPCWGDRRAGDGHHLASSAWPAVTRVQTCRRPGMPAPPRGFPGRPGRVRAVAPVQVRTGYVSSPFRERPRRFAPVKWRLWPGLAMGGPRCRSGVTLGPLEEPGGGHEPCSLGQRGPFLRRGCPAITTGGVRLGGEPCAFRASRLSQPSCAGTARARGLCAPAARAGQIAGEGALGPRRRRGSVR